jgi:hypothetical protein
MSPLFFCYSSIVNSKHPFQFKIGAGGAMHLTGGKKKVGGVLSSDLSKHRVRRDVHIHIIKYAKDYSSQDLYIVKCLSRNSNDIFSTRSERKTCRD